MTGPEDEVLQKFEVEDVEALFRRSPEELYKVVAFLLRDRELMLEGMTVRRGIHSSTSYALRGTRSYPT